MNGEPAGDKRFGSGILILLGEPKLIERGAAIVFLSFSRLLGR